MINQLLLNGSVICISCLWLVAICKLPYEARSLVRYRLWKLRDKIIEALDKEELPESEQVEILYGSTMALIENANRISFLKWMLIPRVGNGASKEKARDMLSEIESWAEPQRLLYLQMLNEHKDIVFRHIVYCSVSGVIFHAIVLSVIAVKAVANLIKELFSGQMPSISIFTSSFESKKAESREQVTSSAKLAGFASYLGPECQGHIAA